MDIPKKFRDPRLARITSSAIEKYTVEDGSKKYRDPRLDRVASHTLDIFSRQNKLGVIRTPTGIGVEHLNTESGSTRFQRHDLPSQTPVAGRRHSGLIRNRITLLSGSLKDEAVEKKKGGEDSQTDLEKKIESDVEKVKETLRRRK